MIIIGFCGFFVWNKWMLARSSCRVVKGGAGYATGRKAKFPVVQYRAQFPVHFPELFLVKFRIGIGKCTGNYALYFPRKVDISKERLRKLYQEICLFF